MIWVQRLAFLILAGFFSGFSQAQKAPVTESNACLKALQLAGQDQLTKAKKMLKTRQCPLGAELVTWLALKSDVSTSSFHEYAAFLKNHKGWPWESVLQIRAELRMDESVSQRDVLSWFKDNPPRTTQGLLRYVRALAATGHRQQAHSVARIFWLNAEFSPTDEKKILLTLKNVIRSSDIKERAVRLLNEGKVTDAQRLVKHVPPSDRATLNVRIALQKQEDHAFSLLKKAGLNPLGDSHLAKDYLTWLRKKQDPRLRDYFQRIMSLTQKNPEKFWKERYILAHETLEAGETKRAYALASGHRLTPGLNYVEAEWFSGWIALRFLKDPGRALTHFKLLASLVKTPISRSRVQYWLGRSYEALGKTKEAKACYEKASGYPGTFYGQRALGKLGRTKYPLAFEPLRFTPLERSTFEAQKTVRFIRLLARAKLEQHILSFAYVFVQRTPSLVQKRQMLALTHEVAPNAAVEIAHVLAQQHTVLHREAYPRLKPIYTRHMAQVDTALVHAVIRKESKFKPDCTSSAGARGLMQLMPETARKIAAQKGLACSEQQLLTDPILNVRLGSVYLKERLEKYERSLPLTLASYNAGPGTVARWLTRFSDPRDPSIDIIDWIEMLPYAETRNYIHRVLEFYEVYKKALTS